MLIQLDWLSFTLPLPIDGMANDDIAAVAAARHLSEFLGEHYRFISGAGDLEEQSGRRPFSRSYRSNSGNVSIYLNHKMSHFLVEFSGRGTKIIMQHEDAKSFLETVKSRVTRIDVACDIETSVNPLEFADKRKQGRFKTHSEIVSDTGTTYYVGSKESNRYARVYRYNDPHPRASLLRVEHVFRAEDAKKTLDYILANGLESAAAQCALMYKWEHEAWDITPATEREMTAYRPDRENANTIFWVHGTVAPLLARLIREGSLDLDEFTSTVWGLAYGFKDSQYIDESTGEVI